MRTTVLFFLLANANLWCLGENDFTRWEAGAFLSTLDLRSPVGEKPGGLGIRTGYNFSRYAVLESEYHWYPHNTQGNFGQRQFVIGVKAGYRFDRFGAFAKLRPGVVHLGGDHFRDYQGRSETLPAVDAGLVFERYFCSRGIFRLDAGDTMVFFGNRTIKTALDTTRPGLAHCPQFSIGLAVSF